MKRILVHDVPPHFVEEAFLISMDKVLASPGAQAELRQVGGFLMFHTWTMKHNSWGTLW